MCSPSACLSISFFAIYSKIFRQPIPENLWPYPIIFADAPMKKKSKIYFHPLSQHFWDTQYKIFFFALIIYIYTYRRANGIYIYNENELSYFSQVALHSKLVQIGPALWISNEWMNKLMNLWINESMYSNSN